MKFAKEVKPSKRLINRLADEVAKVYTDFLFKDIFKVLDEKPVPLQNKNLTNEIEDGITQREYDKYIQTIRDALYEGKIYYKDGNLLTPENQKFGLKLAKAIKILLKGKYNTAKKSYKIDLRTINPTIRADITNIYDKAKDEAKKIQAILQTKETEEVPSFNTEMINKAFDDFYDDLEAKTNESLKLGINQYNKENKERIREEFIETSKYYVVKFDNSLLPDIRERLTKLILEENMSIPEFYKYIKREFDLSKRRCQFIARQETRLIKAELVQKKATENGLDEYIWETAHDERVRSWHRHLDGKKFRFSDPPVIDPRTQKRGNPAQFYNCRCVPKIIVSWD